jgi:hypothetical protein
LIAGGPFAGVVPGLNGVARWDGATWQPLGPGIVSGGVNALAVRSGELIVGGAFSNAGGQLAHDLARWHGASTCRADFDCSYSLTVQDIFDFLNAWFAGDPRADFNGGGLSVQDIFDFLNAWFAGCP